MDSTIVVLTEGEIQRRTRFRNKLFPGFAGGFPYPAQSNTGSLRCAHVVLNVVLNTDKTGGVTTNRSSILLVSCVRISAERLW